MRDAGSLPAADLARIRARGITVDVSAPQTDTEDALRINAEGAVIMPANEIDRLYPFILTEVLSADLHEVGILP